MHTLFLLLGLTFAGMSYAHHGWSEYETTKPLTVTGIINEVGYEHPHGHIRLEGPAKKWFVTLAPPSRMERRGLPAADLKPYLGGRAQVAKH